MRQRKWRKGWPTGSAHSRWQMMHVLTRSGHIHAFWLIWKKIKAEEMYGAHGYTYMGNGEFVGHGGMSKSSPVIMWMLTVSTPSPSSAGVLRLDLISSRNAEPLREVQDVTRRRHGVHRPFYECLLRCGRAMCIGHARLGETDAGYRRSNCLHTVYCCSFCHASHASCSLAWAPCSLAHFLDRPLLTASPFPSFVGKPAASHSE